MAGLDWSGVATTTSCASRGECLSGAISEFNILFPPLESALNREKRYGCLHLATREVTTKAIAREAAISSQPVRGDQYGRVAAVPIESLMRRAAWVVGIAYAIRRM